MRALALLLLVGGCDEFNNGFGVGLRILADGAVAVQTHDFHFEISGAESFVVDVPASAKFVSSGEERVLYRPGVTAGQLDCRVVARDGLGFDLASAEASVKLVSGKTVVATVHLAATNADLAGVDLAGVDLAGLDLAGLDLATTNDLAEADLTGVTGCTTAEDTCSNASTLHHCKSDGSGFDSVVCPLGCLSSVPARCKQVVPTANGVLPADLDGTGLMALTLDADVTINSDDGSISGGIRTANVNPDVREVSANGIAFHRVAIPGTVGSKIGIFSFAGLTINDTRKVIAVGTNALALASSADIRIVGTLDGRGTCIDTAAGPGGGKGGDFVSANGTSPSPPPLGAGGLGGVDDQSDCTMAGGGGANGDDGARSGGPGGCQAPPSGTPINLPALVPIYGGGGGGRGGDTFSTSPLGHQGGLGGGGGGALQLISATQIIIGTSPGGTTQGINAGGCGGKGAAIPNANLGGGGGGGGAGGSVLLEAPVVRLETRGAVVVNGGGGGGGATGNNVSASPGAPGRVGTQQAGLSGGAAGGACGAGGDGGAAISGGSATKGTAGGNGFACAGGGGGSAGRIRINTSSGAVTTNGGFVSPGLADASSHGDVLSTQGPIGSQ